MVAAFGFGLSIESTRDIEMGMVCGIGSLLGLFNDLLFLSRILFVHGHFVMGDINHMGRKENP